ncbi:heptaprenyl diphosphate synthase component 1 [Bacillus sp. NTK071]|uniref:heptaprenyl diphosphate synthase component 1 n=1 Tax=Bacillus sp. NTK071 TaxID=2802175 RepID=UPI001A8CE665|nr:heptaprenyl diphosphate synthase component 1 [Bacillus sp. NTK071]MBN8207993.1 heptaprenyl diphosphate synthase component 1 [Bacillus sp. NTK071]
MTNPKETTYKQIAGVRDMLQSRLSHSYLLQFIDFPIIDEERLYVFYGMLEQTKLERKRKEDTLLSIMLVQIALDTHELISLDEIANENERKNRQLTVLAGDYFSSMYYHILSKWHDNELIRTLSEAIQEINEAKMSFYQTDHRTVESIFDNLMEIESILVRKVAEHFSLDNWKTFGMQYFYMNRLLLERKQGLIHSSSNLLQKIASTLLSVKESKLTSDQQASKARTVLDSYAAHAKKEIDFLCQHYSELHRWFQNRLEYNWGIIGIQEEKLAEEG